MTRYQLMITLSVCLFFVSITSLTPPSFAEIPQLINYQGKVTDSDGAPVPDGTYAMRFSIYDVETGGASIWYSGAVGVQVTGGIFNVLLGESPQPAITLPFDDDYWLSVWIEGDTQTPRQRLGSVGYAYMASGVVPGTDISGSVTTGTSAALTATNTSATGSTYGLWGQNFSTEGAGVRGDAFATTGPNYGVRGACQSTAGAGVYGSALASTGTTYGIYGWSTSPSGRGVHGAASATTGTNYGVYGIAMSPSGYGVYGEALSTTGTTFAVYGTDASTGGYGIYGAAIATSGANYGVYGVSASTGGYGVYGEATATSGTNYGIYGKSAHFYGYAGYFDGNVEVDGEVDVLGTLVCTDATTTGLGVAGSATSTSGYTYGVKGESASTDGQGVYGYSSATTGFTYAVHGKAKSTDGVGVYGEATATTGFCIGVRGGCGSTDGYGVWGSAYGTEGSTCGMHGTSLSTAGTGVRGVTSATTGQTHGVYGSCQSTQGRGVYGHAYATSGGGVGVYGATDSDNGYGGYFLGRLHARENLNATAAPHNHVAHIHNTSTGSSPDVLALGVGTTGDPDAGINFITFYKDYDVAVGAIEGDGSGGITYHSGSADFAEFLAKLDPNESMVPGDIVGVHSGQVSKRTHGISPCMVISTRPIVLGNDPGNGKTDAYARVAFIGQVDVNVRGEVKAGDLLIPSGMEDGTAIAVSQDEITPTQFAQMVGQAWESSMDAGVKKIRSSVGLQNHDPTVERMAETIQYLRNELDDVEARLETVEAHIGVR